MKNYLLIGTLLSSFALHAPANSPGSEYWQRDAAIAAASTRHVDQAALEIGDASTLADATYTLEQLHRLETRADWPLPAREAALHRFARSLAELPQDAVAADVMRHLLSYQSRTLVPHEEQESAYVPLFNIRATAQGVENGWHREAATAQAAVLLLDDPAALVEIFTQLPGNVERQGYLYALELAGAAAVTLVQDEALQRLAAQPGLSPLLAATALMTRDPAAMRELVVHGRGAGLAGTLDRFADDLDAGELAGLLEFTIDQAPASNASLAIAAWWPRLCHDAATRELMLGLLADAELGSSAALALSVQPDVPTIKALKDTAGGDNVAARRAQRALDLNRAKLHPEARP